MKSTTTDLLAEALHDIMTEIVGWNYNDEHGFAERARERWEMYRKEKESAYSERCINAAMRQRKHAHDLMKQGRQIEAYWRKYGAPLPGVAPVAFIDARDALRDAIRWIQQAKVERLKENNAIDMADIRKLRDAKVQSQRISRQIDRQAV